VKKKKGGGAERRPGTKTPLRLLQKTGEKKNTRNKQKKNQKKKNDQRGGAEKAEGATCSHNNAHVLVKKKEGKCRGVSSRTGEKRVRGAVKGYEGG